MAVLPADRVRRTGVALLLATVLVVLAGCSGGDDDKAERPAEGDVIGSLPDAAAVVSAVDDAVGARQVPDVLVPQQALIAKLGSLDGLEQRCVRDYGYTEITDVCSWGDPSAERSILLWGDSRAAMWLPALSRIADQNGYRLAVVSKLGCPPLLGETPWLGAESRPYTECADLNAQVPTVVDDLVKPDIVVLAGAVRNFAVTEDGAPRPLGEGFPDNTWTPDPEAGEIWQRGLRRALESFDDNDAEVFVLGEAPYPSHDAEICLAEHEDSVDECGVTPEEGVYDEHDAAVERTAESNGATYVSPLPWLCSADLCPAVVDGHAVYRDTFHLNREYVLHISRALGSALGLDDWKGLAK